MIANSTVWVLDSHQPEDALMSDHVQALVELVEARESGLLQVAKVATIDFFIGFTPAVGQSTDQLSSGLLSRLARLPIDIVFDFFGAEGA